MEGCIVPALLVSVHIRTACHFITSPMVLGGSGQEQAQFVSLSVER
jgi:hypothetical protein